MSSMLRNWSTRPSVRSWTTLSMIWLPCKCLPSLCPPLLPCPHWLRSTGLVKWCSLCSGRCFSFRENRCTKYHEHLLCPGKVWVSVVPSLVNTHGDFVSLWLLFDSASAILVSCGCPLFVALCLPFQFTSVQTLSTRPIMFVLPKKIAVVHVAFRVYSFACCHSFCSGKAPAKISEKLRFSCVLY